jgi:Mlc titration factor MtfA (ptsG expression regulator)
MTGIYILITVVALIFIGFAAQLTIVRSRRRRLMALRLSDEERYAIAKDFTIFARLPQELRDELEGLMHVFIDEKFFEACGGMEEVTEHMQRVVAAQACLLLVNRKHDFYRKLRSILLYPSAYKAKNEHGQDSVRLGESWHSGSVILAWESVIAGGRNEEDGHHVTLHEFAHQLDQADGAADGVPELSGAGSYREWSMVFGQAFDRFQKKLDKGRRTVIDPYGGTNPAEFFAVATETFYEKPKQLSEHYPQVYQQLCSYYRVDPLDW